jgi:hypothetical protein
MFKVGDKVTRIKESFNPNYYGKVGGVYTVLAVGNDLDIQVVPGYTADKDAFKLVEEEMQYEDDWVLVTKGVTVPDNADVVKSDAGYVVAFRPVKKPKIVGYVRYTSDNPGEDGTLGYKRLGFNHKVIFTTTDGVLTDVRLAKD